jgi:hypothetical protein
MWNALDSGEMTDEMTDENLAESVRRVSELSQRDAHLQALQYSGENKRDELRSSVSVSGLGRRTKAAFRGLGGSMRNLGKKTLSIRNLGKKSSLSEAPEGEGMRRCNPPTKKQATSKAA